jgi:hypothetical protein
MVAEKRMNESGQEESGPEGYWKTQAGQQRIELRVE